MKRIDALKLIANQLDFLNNRFTGYRTEFTKRELSNADVILTTLEQAGMQPPGYMKPIPYEPHQYPLVPGDIKNDQGVWCTPGVQEWEPENE